MQTGQDGAEKSASGAQHHQLRLKAAPQLSLLPTTEPKARTHTYTQHT